MLFTFVAVVVLRSCALIIIIRSSNSFKPVCDSQACTSVCFHSRIPSKLTSPTGAQITVAINAHYSSRSAPLSVARLFHITLQVSPTLLHHNLEVTCSIRALPRVQIACILEATICHLLLLLLLLLLLYVIQIHHILLLLLLLLVTNTLR
jgi:hypothetical protein